MVHVGEGTNKLKCGLDDNDNTNDKTMMANNIDLCLSIVHCVIVTWYRTEPMYDVT